MKVGETWKMKSNTAKIQNNITKLIANINKKTGLQPPQIEDFSKFRVIINFIKDDLIYSTDHNGFKRVDSRTWFTNQYEKDWDAE